MDELEGHWFLQTLWLTIVGAIPLFTHNILFFWRDLCLCRETKGWIIPPDSASRQMIAVLLRLHDFFAYFGGIGRLKCTGNFTGPICVRVGIVSSHVDRPYRVYCSQCCGQYFKGFGVPLVHMCSLSIIQLSFSYFSPCFLTFLSISVVLSFHVQYFLCLHYTAGSTRPNGLLSFSVLHRPLKPSIVQYCKLLKIVQCSVISKLVFLV